jgi:hypothetical protein
MPSDAGWTCRTRFLKTLWSTNYLLLTSPRAIVAGEPNASLWPPDQYTAQHRFLVSDRLTRRTDPISRVVLLPAYLPRALFAGPFRPSSAEQPVGRGSPREPHPLELNHISLREDLRKARDAEGVY